MAHEHRSDGTIFPERGSDSDYIARIGKFLERYKIFWVIITGIFLWWGRNVMIPLQEAALTTKEVRSINTKVDSVIVPWLEKGDRDRTSLILLSEQQGRILGVLSRLQCLRTSAIDRAKIDLNCRDIPIDLPHKESR